MSTQQQVDDPTNSVQRELGKRLRAVRRLRRLTLLDVEQLSDREYRSTTLASYERGDRAITAEKLAGLATVYGIPTRFLVEGDITELWGEPITLLQVDLGRLANVSEEYAGHFADLIHKINNVRRRSGGKRILQLGVDSLRVLAMLYGSTSAELGLKLIEWGAVVGTSQYVPVGP